MRLLITTQTVDLDDPILAFFHRWIEEFAARADHVHVICLREGRHALPANVSVHSLGKESGRSILKYISRFFAYTWHLRNDYDVVFVHMNPEYLVLGGIFWRIWQKSIGLWYIHPRSSWRLRVASVFAHAIFSGATKSFPFRTRKLVPVGHGIDTDFFSPSARTYSVGLRIMSAARIAPVKHVELMLEAAEELKKRHIPYSFDYYGDELPRDHAYAERMRTRADHLTMWVFRGRASQETIRDAYRSHDVHINATDSGSFDKAVFEAMACGCISVASNTALRDILPRELLFEEGNVLSLAQTLDRIAEMPEEDKEALAKRMRTLTVERYSLGSLVERILSTLVQKSA
jgi:glycosyltransferase involved in cell wall biosynthesis